MQNIYGLNRRIPERVKRAVRQRCGFGCIICAGSLFEYEHFNPVFARAKEHRAEGITLLCPTCHAKKTRNLLSNRRLREANADPAAKKLCYAYSEGEGSGSRPYVKLAGMKIQDCKTMLQISGLPIFKVEEPEVSGGPYRLTALFFDHTSRPTLFILKNEWIVFSESWDVEVVGPSITVRTGPGKIVLRLVFVAGEGLVVDRLVMQYAGYTLLGNPEALEVIGPSGNRAIYVRCIADGSEIGFSVG